MRGWPSKPRRFSSRSATSIHCSRVSCSPGAMPRLAVKERLRRLRMMLGDVLQRFEGGDGIGAEAVEAARLDKFDILAQLAGHKIPGELAAVAVEITLRDHGSKRPGWRQAARQAHRAQRISRRSSASIWNSRRRLLCSCAIKRKLVERPRDLVHVIADAIELDQGLRQRRGIDRYRPAVQARPVAASTVKSRRSSR